MESYSVAPHILALAGLFFIAVVSAIVLKKIKIPYTIGLVVIGVFLAYFLKRIDSLDAVRDIRLSHDVIMYVLLPTLIFDAAININARALFKNITPILILAVPGLLVSTFVVGFLLNLVTPLHLGTAVLFGALISATDPVAVVSLFKEIGAPEKLSILVDGESLFNDATAIVMFNIILVAIVSEIPMDLGGILSGVMDFFFVFFGGILVGIIIGYIVLFITKFSKDDPLIHLALTSLLAYTSFIVAEYYMEVSGVMAVLAGGILLSWYGAERFPKASRIQIEHFWEYATFVCNSFIFLLLGVAELQLLGFIGHSSNIVLYVICAIITVTIARLIVVYIVPYMFPLKFGKVEAKYKAVIFWGGLRGAVPLALVLSLSKYIEDQQLLVELTLGIVLFTLLVQGTTIKPLMKILKLGSE